MLPPPWGTGTWPRAEGWKVRGEKRNLDADLINPRPMRAAITRLLIEDRNVAVVIGLNAVVLFLLSFPQLEHNLWLEILDACFLLYFLLEALVKIRRMGWARYIHSRWNQLDFGIVLLSIPSVILLFQPSLPNLAFVFLFRVLRILRFFKFIKFIPNIRELIAGVRRAFKASIFVVLAFFIFSFLISLISCRIFQDLSPALFGDPLSSFYNIFKVFTIEGWYEVPEQLIADAQLGTAGIFLVKLYFVIIVVAGGIFGLSIVNAIFVEEMVRDNNDELEQAVADMQRKLDLLVNRLAPMPQAQEEPSGESPPGPEVP